MANDFSSRDKSHKLIKLRLKLNISSLQRTLWKIPILDREICEFETKFTCEVTRLNNNQSILILDNEIEKIG